MQLKPWLTPGLLNSIKIRDRLFVKFKNAKDKERKSTLSKPIEIQLSIY